VTSVFNRISPQRASSRENCESVSKRRKTLLNGRFVTVMVETRVMVETTVMVEITVMVETTIMVEITVMVETTVMVKLFQIRIS
jgi:hypothetical protein